MGFMQLLPTMSELVLDRAMLCTPTPVLSYFRFPKSSPFPGTGSDRCCPLTWRLLCRRWPEVIILLLVFPVMGLYLSQVFRLFRLGECVWIPSPRGKNTHWVGSCSRSSVYPQQSLPLPFPTPAQPFLFYFSLLHMYGIIILFIYLFWTSTPSRF